MTCHLSVNTFQIETTPIYLTLLPPVCPYPKPMEHMETTHTTLVLLDAYVSICMQRNVLLLLNLRNQFRSLMLGGSDQGPMPAQPKQRVDPTNTRLLAMVSILTQRITNK